MAGRKKVTAKKSKTTKKTVSHLDQILDLEKNITQMRDTLVQTADKAILSRKKELDGVKSKIAKAQQRKKIAKDKCKVQQAKVKAKATKTAVNALAKVKTDYESVMETISELKLTTDLIKEEINSLKTKQKKYALMAKAINKLEKDLDKQLSVKKKPKKKASAEKSKADESK